MTTRSAELSKPHETAKMRIAMIHQGISVNGLSRLLGLSQGYTSRLISGDRRSPVRLAEIANILGLNFEEPTK